MKIPEISKILKDISKEMTNTEYHFEREHKYSSSFIWVPTGSLSFTRPEKINSPPTKNLTIQSRIFILFI